MMPVTDNIPHSECGGKQGLAEREAGRVRQREDVAARSALTLLSGVRIILATVSRKGAS
jgi:hypothetical protein